MVTRVESRQSVTGSLKLTLMKQVHGCITCHVLGHAAHMKHILTSTRGVTHVHGRDSRTGKVRQQPCRWEGQTANAYRRRQRRQPRSRDGRATNQPTNSPLELSRHLGLGTAMPDMQQSQTRCQTQYARATRQEGQQTHVQPLTGGPVEQLQPATRDRRLCQG